MIRRTGQVVGILLAIVALCLLLLQTLPGPWMARQASAAGGAWSGLIVDIQDLRITSFSRTPSAIFSSLSVSATPDSARLYADELTVSVSLSALLRGEFVLDRLVVSEGGVNARIDEQGLNNWHTEEARKSTDRESMDIASLLDTLRDARIDDLVVESFTVNLFNAELNTELSLLVEGVASTYDATRLSHMQIKGVADGQAVNLNAEFGFLGDIARLPANARTPITLDISASVGEDQLSLKGSVGKPDTLQAVNAVFSLKVASPRHWQAFFPSPLPDLLPLSIAGDLTRGREDWLLRHIKGRLGSSDVSGEIRVDSSTTPIGLDARLVSAQLAPDELLALQDIDFRAPSINGSVDYRAEQVVSERWPLDSVDMSAVLDNQRLTVAINRIGLRGGELDGEIIRELQSQPVVTRLRFNLKRLDLQRLLPQRKSDEHRAGHMAARAELSVTGDTRDSMRSSVDGALVTLMTGDWLDTLLHSALGAEVAGSLMVDRSADEKSEQDCAFLELQAAEGIVQLRSLVFDTDTIVYLGEGEFDWQHRSIDLTVEPHYKDSEADADAVYVSGALSAPRVESVHPFLTRDSAMSVLDATITPAVALMPFLNAYSDSPGVVCQGFASALDDPQ